jgi:hypothetical protein
MSYTLKKLKQSEIDHGYRNPSVNNKKTEPSYGLFIACFTIVLAVSLVLVKGGEDFFSQLSLSDSKQVSVSLSNEESVSIASKNISEYIPGNSPKVIEQKNTGTEENGKDINIEDFDKVISANHTGMVASAPSILSEPHLYNPAAEGNFFEILAKKQNPENNFLEKSEQLINLATYANEQTSPKEEKKAPENNKPVLWQELPSNVKRAMPEMNLNGVAFLDNEADRYIFINMNKYQVGDDVDMGPSVEEIRKDSAIMRYKKRLFILTLHE